MGALSLTIQVNNLQHAQDNMKRLGVGFHEGMTPALETIGTLGSKYFGGVAFQQKGAAFGMPWQPLADATVKDKTKHYPGRPDLVRTDEMRNSFTFKVQSPTSVRLYNTDPKFEHHQLGAGGKGDAGYSAKLAVARTILGVGGAGAVGRGSNLPQRIMIGVNTSLKTIIRNSIKAQVAVIIKGIR